MDFLGRARKSIKGWSSGEPARPQYFSVTCPAGHALRGLRNEGYQALRCPSCGMGVFVLPRSPLPDPPAPSRGRARPLAADAVGPGPEEDQPLILSDPTPIDEVEEVVWLDEPESGDSAPLAEVEIPEEYRQPASEPTPVAARAVRSPHRSPKPAAAVAAEHAGTAGPVSPAGAPAVPPGTILIPQHRSNLRTWAGRHRVSLVLAGVLGLVLSTIGYRLWVQRWENLPQVAASNLADGEAAFDAGRFDEAKLKLRRSADAFRELGLGDERAARAQQLAAESAILADLARVTLEELIEEAAKFNPPDRWAERFNAIYRGQSVILDTTLLSRNGGVGGGPELAYRVYTGRGPTPARQGQVDLKGLKLFDQLDPQPGQPLLIGARLESLQLDQGVWHIGLEPRSGVVLTRLEAVKSTGWDPLQSASTAERGVGREQASDAASTPVQPGPGAVHPLLLGLLGMQIGPPPPTRVEVNDLARRPDLVGRLVEVDGRIRLFQFHPGRGFDELTLKESAVLFRLPPSLRRNEAPAARGAILQGKLVREGEGLVVEVSGLQLLPDDQERLEKGLAILARTDFKGRMAWAQWATRRARLYHDQPLASRAQQVATETHRLEAERPESQSPEAALALAQRAREAGIPEPDPGALVHRAFVARARSAKGFVECDRLAQELLPLLPGASEPHPGPIPPDWLAPYQNDPYRAYLRAPAAARQALDRQLWADLVERSLSLRAEASPREATALAREAQKRLPDRPGLTASLLEKGLNAAAQDVTTLRRTEVMELAQAYDKMGEAETGRQKIRAWLNAQRGRNLARDDADGRLALAEDFRTLLGDRVVAAELLREAAQIDPNSEPVADAFRRLGYRKEAERWVDAGGRANPDPGPEAEGVAGLNDAFENLSLDDVQARLGRPDRKSQVITQNRVLLQWIYEGTRGRTQVINFIREPGAPARVLSRYTPR